MVRRWCMNPARQNAKTGFDSSSPGTHWTTNTIGMKSKVHPAYKTKYRVANWPAYERALVRRGEHRSGERVDGPNRKATRPAYAELHDHSDAVELPLFRANACVTCRPAYAET